MSGLVKAGIENDAGDKTISADELTGSLSVSGSTSFFNSSNTIRLPNIGNFGLAVGDVITVTGTSNNNKDFTVEVISDINNIIVNQAHAGGTTTKSLVNETVSATITLVARAGKAELGLGQGWVDMSSVRSINTNYTNATGRTISVSIVQLANNVMFFTVDLIPLTKGGNDSRYHFCGGLVGNESVYKAAGGTVNEWSELR